MSGLPGPRRRRLARRNGREHEEASARPPLAWLHGAADPQVLRAVLWRVRSSEAEVRRSQHAGLDSASWRAARRGRDRLRESEETRETASFRRSVSVEGSRDGGRREAMSSNTDWTSALAILAAGV